MRAKLLVASGTRQEFEIFETSELSAKDSGSGVLAAALVATARQQRGAVSEQELQDDFAVCLGELRLRGHTRHDASELVLREFRAVGIRVATIAVTEKELTSVLE